ncbi:ficolin-1-like [Saccostrea cucullata]|uniref:ficolin-1-like n=1 Tax=Saccostrea cuccullata TaxID=36930 RepID=UPI002ECFFAD3
MKTVDPVSMKVDVVYTYDVTKISRNRFQDGNKDKDCATILKKNPGRRGRDGVYTIYPDGIQGKRVYYDMTTEGGGWTVLQRRQDGSTDFYRTWREYKQGFRDTSTNYWIGNDAIYQLTKKNDQVLRVWLKKFNGDEGYAQYTTFYVGNEGSKYKLTVSGYSGTAGDSLRGARFSIKDQENDRCSDGKCTTKYHGAWWYTWYGVSNLNGLYSRYRVFAYKYPKKCIPDIIVTNRFPNKEKLNQKIVICRTTVVMIKRYIDLLLVEVQISDKVQRQ